jgi:hypothetical protein
MGPPKSMLNRRACRFRSLGQAQVFPMTNAHQLGPSTGEPQPDGASPVLQHECDAGEPERIQELLDRLCVAGRKS